MDNCDFYITVTAGPGNSNCLVGATTGSSHIQAAIAGFDDNTKLHAKRGFDIMRSISDAITKKMGNKFLGRCQGAAIHTVRGSMWSLTFQLVYGNNYECTFVIVNALSSPSMKIRLSVSNFHVR